MTVLNIDTAPSTDEHVETAVGRFFDPVRAAQDFSVAFTIRNADMLPGQVGQVCQIGLANESITACDDPQATSVESIVFDARESKSGKYHWQLISTDQQNQTSVVDD